MAIGDTVNAGLMRVDFSPFLEAGRANAAANASFGQALGQVAKGYIEGQEKKKRTSEIAGFLMGQGVAEKDATAIAKNPFLQKEYQRKKEADVRKEIAAMQSKPKGNDAAMMQAELAKKKYEDEVNARAIQTQREVNFAQNLLAETTDPAVQSNADMVRPGLFALGGDTEMRNRFLDAEIERQPKATVGNLGSEDFATVARERGMDPILSANRFMNLQAGEVKQAQKIARTITVQDGQGGFTQVGVDEAGNPVRDFGPPKPSGMYPTPEEKTKEIIEVGRTKDAMETVKNTVNESNLAIKQAEQAELALTNLPETTGGITSFINDMKVLAESVGIDLPEEYQKDMKDIGVFRQVTGQFLFNAMSNTKGSITENEMTLFRKISPDIDNSRAANEAMLKLYVKAGQRAKGRRDLIRSLQKQKVNPVLIQEQIEKFDEENSLMGDIQALAPNSTTKTKFNFNGQNIDVEIVGERKDGTPIYKDKKTGQVLVQQPAQ